MQPPMHPSTTSSVTTAHPPLQMHPPPRGRRLVRIPPNLNQQITRLGIKPRGGNTQTSVLADFAWFWFMEPGSLDALCSFWCLPRLFDLSVVSDPGPTPWPKDLLTRTCETCSNRRPLKERRTRRGGGVVVASLGRGRNKNAPRKIDSPGY